MEIFYYFDVYNVVEKTFKDDILVLNKYRYN